MLHFELARSYRHRLNASLNTTKWWLADAYLRLFSANGVATNSDQLAYKSTVVIAIKVNVATAVVLVAALPSMFKL